MNSLSSKIGYWSAMALTICMITWIICFTGIAITSPLFHWTNLSDYLTYESLNSQTFQIIAKIFMLLFGPLYVLLINSYYDYSSESNKILLRAGLIFGAAFAILSCIHYFVQLSSVRINILDKKTSGLEHFIQANPYSVLTAIDMLGWTLFLGLSSLFIAPTFVGNKLNNIIRIALLTNGISCLIAGIGYVLRETILTFIFINLGLGGASIIFSIASLKFFRRLRTNVKPGEDL